MEVHNGWCHKPFTVNCATITMPNAYGYKSEK